MVGFYQNKNLSALAGSRLVSPDCRVLDDATASCTTAEGVGHDQFWRVVSYLIQKTTNIF